MPPGCCGAGRPEKRVIARSKPPQKTCDGLDLPRKLSAEAFQRHVGDGEDAPHALGDLRTIFGDGGPLGERGRIHDLDRHRPDFYIDLKRGEPRHDLGIEIGDRHRRERNDLALPVARRDDEPVVEKIEIDLESSVAVRHRRSRQPARGQIERDMPPMVFARRPREPHLADDLRPHLQRRRSLKPALAWRLRPRR